MVFLVALVLFSNVQKWQFQVMSLDMSWTCPGHVLDMSWNWLCPPLLKDGHWTHPIGQRTVASPSPLIFGSHCSIIFGFDLCSCFDYACRRCCLLRTYWFGRWCACSVANRQIVTRGVPGHKDSWQTQVNGCPMSLQKGGFSKKIGHLGHVQDISGTCPGQVQLSSDLPFYFCW